MKTTAKVFELPVIIEKDEDGYVGVCPPLKGCYTQGNTYEEVIKNLEDAIKLNLKDMEERREKLPVFENISLTTIKVVA